MEKKEFAIADLKVGQLNALVKILGGSDIVMEILRGTREVTTSVRNFIAHIFSFVVDETMSVENVVKEGKFERSNDEINCKNFPRLKNGKKFEKEIVLFKFDRDMWANDVIEEMDRVGYRPATIWELVALFIREASLAERFHIVALGSSSMIRGFRRVPFICRGGKELGLTLGDNCLLEGCLYIAVKK